MLPIFITSSPQREYEFYFKISTSASQATGLISYLTEYASKAKEIFGGKSVKDFAMALLDEVVAAYVSQLCQIVNPPKEELRLDKAVLGTVEYSFPIGFAINTISATFLEDRYGTVYNYHKKWQNLISLSSESTRTLSLNALYPVSRKLTYAMTYKTNPAKMLSSVSIEVSSKLPAIETPTNISVYPRVFPIDISRSTADKAGNKYGTVEVTYGRLPYIENFNAYTHVNPTEVPTKEQNNKAT